MGTKKTATKKATKTATTRDANKYPEGVLLQAADGFYPAQFLKRVFVAPEGVTGAKPGDIVFEFLFGNGEKLAVVEPSNNHIRKGQLARINRAYELGMGLIIKGGGCGK